MGTKKQEELSIGKIVFVILFFIALGIFLVFMIFRGSQENKCFTKIAKNYCEEKGLEFYNQYSNMMDGFRFSCMEKLIKTRESNRNYNYTKYYFFEEEIKECS